jgi:FO synthase
VRLESILNRALAGDRPCAAEAQLLATAEDTERLCSVSAQIRDLSRPDLVTYSPKVFIPLTRLCRDICGYCTFAEKPQPTKSAYLSEEEVLAIARAGARAGCREALFTLGDRPEERWPSARRALETLGFPSTLHYLRHLAERVLAETGLLPHLNPGNMSREEIEMLRPVSASMGLMIENISARLCARGGAHFGCVDKAAELRVATIRAAGEALVPFTTGILIGIGETRRDRIESLLAIRELDDRFGHIQEVIVQNFLPKPGTRMSRHPAASVEDHRWTIAVARIILGSAMSLQAPPNLAPGEALLAAGINDWGGISPVTVDHVNPEAPWPEIEVLAEMTQRAGRALAPRLPLYPEYVADLDRWAAPEIRAAIRRSSDVVGLAREDEWTPGLDLPLPAMRCGSSGSASPRIREILERSRAGEEIEEEAIAALFDSRDASYRAVLRRADEIRRDVNGDTVHYVVNRNINYTNVCTYRCRFCAFSKGGVREGLRGKSYDLSAGEFSRRVAEAWERGATEVCLQGGIHPDYTGETYLSFVQMAKSAAPGIHVHAFSPLEITQGARSLRLSLIEYLRRLKDAGLASLPGTAAEILDDEVRRIICPDKLDTAGWFRVMEAAHSIGLRSTATIMYGHVERPVHWARHLVRLRDHQKRFDGFTEIVPLPFVAHEAPMYKRGTSRRGPTWREAVLMHAVARIALTPYIRHVQTSWVKMGPQGARVCLEAGADDLGGTLMNESITRAAGAMHGQELSPERMSDLIRGLRRVPAQRTTLYARAPEERVHASFHAARLAPIVETPLGSRRHRAVATRST